MNRTTVTIYHYVLTEVTGDKVGLGVTGALVVGTCVEWHQLHGKIHPKLIIEIHGYAVKSYTKD